jgi:Tfp pilus assembly protein PilZ
MRVTGKGIGIRFIHLPLAKRRDIRRMLRDRFSLRQKVDVPCRWIFDGVQIQSRMLDISRQGCYIQAELADVTVGMNGVVKVALSDASYSVSGHVVWMNRDGIHQKPVGFGLRFDRRPVGFVKKTVALHGLGALVR